MICHRNSLFNLQTFIKYLLHTRNYEQTYTYTVFFIKIDSIVISAFMNKYKMYSNTFHI